MMTTVGPCKMMLIKITVGISFLMSVILQCSAQGTNTTASDSAVITVANSTMVNSTQKSTPRFIKINTSISNWAKAGIAVGLTLGVVLVAGIVAASCHCWLRNQKGSDLIPDKEEDIEEEVRLAE